MRRSTRRALLLGISMILLLSFLASESANLADQGSVNTFALQGAFLSPVFNGIWFSGAGSPRVVSEYLFGGRSGSQQTILSGGTDIISIDIPSGWTPIDLSTRVYQLSANQSYSRNPGFSDSYVLGGRTMPSYWSNGTTNPSRVNAQYNATSQEVYLMTMTNVNINQGNHSQWSQLVYINGSSFTQAKLAFDVRKNPSTLTGGNDGKLNASVYVNQKRVFSSTYANLPLSYATQVIALSNIARGIANITLEIEVFSHLVAPSFNGYVYFDNVYLFANSSVSPRSIDLKLNGSAVTGSQYGNGSAHLHGALTTPFTFTSNTTGRVRFRCDSTLGICLVGSSYPFTFAATQGPTVNTNVSRASFLNASPWTLGSTVYTQDVLNISIPHSWVYSGVVFPGGGGVSGESPGKVKKYDNGTSWIIKINATSIGSYGPNPYTVQATSTNCLGALSTFRKMNGGWISADFFVNGSRIMINATVQGGSSSQGSAYVVFYDTSDYSVWRNMSTYTMAPYPSGKLSFDFAWSNSNVTESGLIALVKWMNSTEMGVNWVPITFDLTPPQVKISLPYSSDFAGGVADITVWNTDAHPKNITLFIDGSQVGSWTSPSGTYSWNTKLLSDGPVEIKVTGWDLVDHVNTTTFQVIVDNRPPTLITNLPDLNNSYVHKTVTLSASYTDLNPRNVTIYLDGAPHSSSSFGGTSYFWDTTSYRGGYEGWVNVTAVSWDQAGNFNRTQSRVCVDNTPPSIDMYVWNVTASGNQYTGGNRTISILCNDQWGFKNVSLSIGGAAKGTWSSTSPSYEWNTTTDGGYTLIVNAWDLAGNNRTISRIVLVDNTPPITPSPVYPNNGEKFNVTTLTQPISWDPSSDSGSGLDHYILQLATSVNFDTNFRQIIVTGTSYAIPPAQPLSNGTWYWRVSAVDRVGNTAQSATYKFDVIVELAPPQGLPITLILGIGSVSAVAILSSVILLRRRKSEPEEFDRSNLMVAYIFSSDGRAMFEHQFKEVKVEPQLVSGFLTAISEMMREVIGGDKRPLRTIERSDAKILIEFGTIVTGALVAKKSSREYRRRLKAFINRFEDDYADKIVKWNGDQSFFQAAPEVIEDVFSEKTKVATYPTIGGLEDLLFSEKLFGVAVSVQGKTGSGKTEFCLRYASSLLKRGKPVIVVAASLAPKDVREDLTNNGVEVAKVEKAGRLIIYDAYSESSGVHSDEKYKFGSPGELNSMNIAISKNLGELKNAAIIFDSLSAIVDYSELELVADFIRTIKAKLSKGGHSAFFVIDSNAHSKSQLNYLLSSMDGEIETVAEATKKGELERLVSFKRLKGFKVKPGYHEFK